jgi:hypothetical protein
MIAQTVFLFHVIWLRLLWIFNESIDNATDDYDNIVTDFK